MKVAIVHQDPGIREGREKGAAVHIASLREAFTANGAEVHLIEEPDGDDAIQKLMAKGPFDMVYERFSLGTGPIAAWAKSEGIAYGLEVNSPMDIEEATYRGGAIDPALREGWRAAFHSAKLVAVVSQPLVDYVTELGASPGVVRVISNGVDLSVFAPLTDRAQAREELDLSPGQIAIAFHGRLRPWHDLPLLARAVRRARNNGADLVLVCIGRGEFAEAAGDVLPPEALRISGWSDKHGVARKVGACDLVALSHSNQEATWFSPLKLREAMAQGLVPIVPALGDLPDAVLSGRAGLLYLPGDEESLAAGLYELAKDQSLRENFAEVAMKEAKRHDWTVVASRILTALGGTPACERS